MWKARHPSWRRRIFGKNLFSLQVLFSLIRRALCVILLTLAGPALAAPSVMAVRIDSFASGAHVILELSQPLTPRVFTMANPDRLVIDMPEVVWGVPQTSGPVDSPLIRNFGYAPHMPGVSRLVLDLAEPAQLLGYDLRPGPNGHYLDIALAAPGRRGGPAPSNPQMSQQPRGQQAAPPATSPTPPARPEEPPAEVAETPAPASPTAGAEAEQAARLIVEEEMRRIVDEQIQRRLADERARLADERARDNARIATETARLAEERARLAAIQAAEEARIARLRESAGPSLMRPTIAPIVAAPPPPTPPMAQAVAPPVRQAAIQPPPPPPGPLKTEKRAETAVRKANSEPHRPRAKLSPNARTVEVASRTPTSSIPAPGGYSATLSDVSAINGLFGVGAAQAAIPTPKPAPPAAARKLLVMLDPGHGGKDPGAVRNGIREKDVVLEFAKLLRDKLVASGRYQVQMTRTADRFVELDDRVEAARVMNADILISIHADALESGDVSGATAYLISEQGSNAQLEQIIQNQDSAGTVAGVVLASEDIDIARTLIDLARRTTRNLSKEFADVIMEEFSKVTPVVRRAVRPANYVVLRAPDTPAVLLELGFMSNDADLKRLQSAEWRETAANAVMRALDAWRQKR